MDILILAGGRCDPDLAAATGVTMRANLPTNEGGTMLGHVIEVCQPLGRIVLVGEPREGVTSTPPGATFVESITRGLELIETSHFLLATADIPWVATDHLRDFVQECDLTKLLNYPIIPMELCEKEFPGQKRTTLRLREGRFTGGNVAMIHTDFMRGAAPRMKAAYAARKKPLALGAMVGWGFLMRMLVGRLFPAALPISSIENSVGRLLGGAVKGVIVRHAAIGADIDDLEQYQAYRIV